METNREQPSAFLYIDTNVIDDPSPAAVELRDLAEHGWVLLEVTDALLSDLTGADAPTRKRIATAAEPFPMSRGPFVLDESLLGVGLIASEDDAIRHDELRNILTPPEATSNRRRSNDTRDAMHIGTAIRYGAQGFVTRDKNVLRRRALIAAKYNSFAVMTPEDARNFVLRLKARSEHRNEGH